MSYWGRLNWRVRSFLVGFVGGIPILVGINVQPYSSALVATAAPAGVETAYTTRWILEGAALQILIAALGLAIAGWTVLLLVQRRRPQGFRQHTIAFVGVVLL